MDILQYINYEQLLPLALYALGMAVYAVFIWKFYRFLGRRDIITFDIEKYSKSKHPVLVSFVGFIAYVFNYIILVPVSAFLWFAVLSVFLLFMSKSQPVSQILLISMAIIAATRITSYYHEDLSRDLAKMLPFALLGIFAVDSTFFSLDLIVERVKEMPSLMMLIVNYLAFVVALEFVLRILYAGVSLFKVDKKKD